MTEPGWYDQFLAAPAVGVLLAPWMGFAPGVWAKIEEFAPQLEVAGTRLTVQTENAVSVRLERSDGVYVDLSPSTVLCGVRHRVQMKRPPGQLPQLESEGTPKAFTELYETVLKTLIKFFQTKAGPQTHDLVRIGCVFEARMAERQAPPGVAQLISHLGQPWPNRLRATDANVLIELSKRDDGRDQCHHALSINRIDKPDDLEFRLDWQRVWEPRKTFTRDAIAREIKAAMMAAQHYFTACGEQLGTE